MDIEKQIEILIDKINELNYYYYTLDDPIVSDAKYDQLYDRLVQLENEYNIHKPYSPTNKVGDQILDKFVKHYHINRLYSLDKSQSYEDIKRWIDRAEKFVKDYNRFNEDKLPLLEYVMEYKFDGLTINLTYEDGILTTCASRGNGIVGEDITSQVKTIKSIPLKINQTGKMEIQGEGLMPLSALDSYNKLNDIKLKNARNAAAGALRNLNIKETQKRNLDAFFYNIGLSDVDFKTEIDMMEYLKSRHFKVNDYLKLVKSYDEIIEELEKIREERAKLDYLTDGVVIKINDKKTQQMMGYTNKFPRWAIAYKYEPEEFTTYIEQVIWNVGRSGKVTPSAIVSPVDFDGVTVRRATLNNYDDILRKKVKLGSLVYIRRSNDVIPEILGVVDENQEGTEIIEKPTNCPSCNSELVETNVHIYCPNSLSCFPQLLKKIEHYSSINAMNIEGFSEKTIALFMKEFNITKIHQIYDIKYEDIVKLEGFKEKRSKNIIDSIEKSKRCHLSNFIYALSIPNVGIKTANDLAKRFKTLDNLRSANREELISISDVGEIIADSIVEFFSDKNIKESLDMLLSKNIKFIKEDDSGNMLKEKTFVITGTIEKFKRNDIKKLLEKNGAKVTTSVSKNTDYLLCGENPGSKKDKAKENNVEILENEKLYEFINNLLQEQR